MKSVHSGTARSGLTLIELLITLTILAIAGVLVSGSLTTGLRAWQSGMRHGREDLVARIVVERLAAQLRTAVEAMAVRENNPTIAFSAGEDSLRFVTVATDGGVPVQVSYALEGDGEERHLVYREYPWPDKDFFGASRPRREEKVPEVVGLSVSVKRSTDDPGGDDVDGNVVPEDWDPADQVLPASVTIDVDVAVAGEEEPRRHSVVVTPLMASKP